MFENISLLVTHYNRSQSLERLLKALSDQNIQFGDIVVSDDCSVELHLNRLKELSSIYNFRLVTSSENKGLGNNINKGQDLVTKSYTLYIQEDFSPLPGYFEYLKNALEIMEEHKEVDLVRFYAYFDYPYLKSYKNGFSEMLFDFWYPGYRKFHMYSDHPHLRRSNFFAKFGRYTEGLKGDRTEFLMALSFLKNKGKAMMHRDIKGIFKQENLDDEPTTMKRNKFRQSTNPIVGFGRMLYRNVKHHYELITFKGE